MQPSGVVNKKIYIHTNKQKKRERERDRDRDGERERWRERERERDMARQRREQKEKTEKRSREKARKRGLKKVLQSPGVVVWFVHFLSYQLINIYTSRLFSVLNYNWANCTERLPSSCSFFTNGTGGEKKQGKEGLSQ